MNLIEFLEWINMPYKVCGDKKCGAKNGVRSHKCKTCGYSFNKVQPNIKPSVLTPTTELIKRKDKKKKKLVARKRKGKKPKLFELVKDFTTLQPRDIISVIGGGPYFPAKNGTKIAMGERGFYKVISIDREGLICMDRKNGGTSFIYCGKRGVSENTGLVKRPHKIRKMIRETELEANGGNIK